MRALPNAGGVLDQPLIVRRAWPILEAEMERFERLRKVESDHGAMLALVGGMFGKGRR